GGRIDRRRADRHGDRGGHRRGASGRLLRAARSAAGECDRRRARTRDPEQLRRQSAVEPAEGRRRPSRVLAALPAAREAQGDGPRLGRELIGARIITHLGQGAPARSHCSKEVTNAGRETGGTLRSPPGFQPQPTSLSSLTWTSIAFKSRPRVTRLSLIASHKARGDNPMKTILASGGGSCQFGAPGGACAP